MGRSRGASRKMASGKPMGFLAKFGLAFLACCLLGFGFGPLENLLPVPPAPSESIEQLAIATTMTPKAKRLFYWQNPSIEQQASFMSRCKVPDQGIMLGCYSLHNGEGKIVIQSVADKRLQGVMEITAAHEMLHAAYQKLSQSKKDWLEPKLIEAARLVKEPRLAKILQQYASDADKDLTSKKQALYLNELHSHLGTELADLQDEELEQYYQQYFENRSRVTDLAQQSGAALKQLDSKVAELKPKIDAQETQLKQFKHQLDETEDTLRASSNNLDRLNVELDRTKQQAEQAYRQGIDAFTLVNQFEQQKASFNAQVDQHNELVQQQKEQVKIFNEKINVYKQDIQAYNQVAQEERSLMDSLKGETIQERKPAELESPTKLNSTSSLEKAIEQLQKSN